MNWARKLDRKSRSLRSPKTSAASRWRPKARTSACPVYISSTWPLRSPVLFHCSANSGWARLPMRAVTSTAAGMLRRAISASSQEMENIIASTATRVSRETMTWESTCWRDWATLSMSLVTRLRTSPRDWPLKCRSGSRASLAWASRRSRPAVRWTAPLVSRPWTIPKPADATYTASTHSRTVPRAPKSIPVASGPKAPSTTRSVA